uniref:ACB domain-containing protein n=1 Tax=Parascaris univalens TaxID=6257 RepID=A0A914ZI29_PARUN
MRSCYFIRSINRQRLAKSTFLNRLSIISLSDINGMLGMHWRICHRMRQKKNI